MFRRTFLALAGLAGAASASRPTPVQSTDSDHDHYDIHPSDSDSDIQAALNGGGLVRAAPGDYTYSQDFEIHNGTTLRGAGEGRTVFAAQGPYGIVYRSTPSRDITTESLTIDIQNNGVNAVKLWGCENVTVQDVTVRNAGTREGETNAGGLHARVDSNDSAGNILVENVTAVNCSAVSIDCGGNAYDAGPVTIRDCEVRYPDTSNRFTHGISAESTDGARITDCRLVDDSTAQLAINVNACANTVVQDCHVTGWSNGLHNYNARTDADLSVRDCEFHQLGGTGIKVQPAGTDSYGNDVVGCRFDGCQVAIEGKHGGAIDIHDCIVTDAKKAVVMDDITTALTIRGLDVRDGRDPDERTIAFKGDGTPLADQYGQFTDNFVDAVSGWVSVGKPATVASNTILGSWGELGNSGSLKMSTADAHVHGNTLGGYLKYADNCVTRDNEEAILS